MSVTKFDQGGAIIAHEIGHSIDFAFEKVKLSAESSEMLREAKQCLNGNHLEEINGDGIQENLVTFKDLNGSYEQGRFAAEDFADFVAAKTYPKETVKADCLLGLDVKKSLIIDESKTGQTYQELFLEQGNDVVHSKDLYRLWFAARKANQVIPKKMSRNYSPNCHL